MLSLRPHKFDSLHKLSWLFDNAMDFLSLSLSLSLFGLFLRRVTSCRIVRTRLWLRLLISQARVPWNSLSLRGVSTSENIRLANGTDARRFLCGKNFASIPSCVCVCVCVCVPYSSRLSINQTVESLNLLRKNSNFQRLWWTLSDGLRNFSTRSFKLILLGQVHVE